MEFHCKQFFVFRTRLHHFTFFSQYFETHNAKFVFYTPPCLLKATEIHNVTKFDVRQKIYVQHNVL